MADQTLLKMPSSPRKRGSSDCVPSEATTLDSRPRGNDEQKQLLQPSASYCMDDWTRTTIGEFVALQRGYDLTDAERTPGNVPVMGAAGQNGFHNVARATAPGIVLGRSGGSYGEVHLARRDFWPHNTAMFVTDFKGNDPFFAYYFLKNLDLKSLNSGSAQPSLNRNYVYPLRIHVPKVDEQKKIAAVLSALDAKIDLNHRINAELEALAKTIYDYWFVQFDFPDAHGRPWKSSGGAMVWNDTPKREIPAGWEAKRLEEFGALRNGVNYDPSVGGDAVAKIVNVRNVSASTVFVKADNLDALHLDQANIDKYLVTDDSILIARSGIPGATRMMSPCPPNTIYCGFIICMTVADSTNRNTLFFRLKQIESALLSQSSGSILKNVSQETLKEIPVAIPANGATRILQLFNNVIDPLFRKISLNDQENIELTRLRDWLLPLLMNGQVRVA